MIDSNINKQEMGNAEKFSMAIPGCHCKLSNIFLQETLQMWGKCGNKKNANNLRYKLLALHAVPRAG